MDQQQESNQNSTTGTAQAHSASASDSTQSEDCTQPAPNVSTLLDESPLPRPVCEWIKCLRAPAMSLSISMEKQHIPNYDATSAQGGNGSGGSGGAQASGTQANNSQASNSQAGGTEGMSFSHRCTVRYFDLALGAVAVLLLGCLCKTCTGCKRAVKRWF